MSVFSQLSIVIPVGPDDAAWRGLIQELSVLGDDIEIILSACQMPPEDFKLANNITWIQTISGRARQLNAGALQVSKEFVWFVHADTRFTAAVVEALHCYLLKEALSMGYFRLQFAHDGPKQTQLNAWAANIRSRYFGLPFGDQGFILKKSLFEQFQGFNEAVSVGEDLDFVVRVQASGIALQELPAELITSARRYQQQGWFATTLRHIYLTWRLTRQAKRRLEVSR